MSRHAACPTDQPAWFRASRSLAVRPRCQRPLAGYQVGMKRDREMSRERDDELDSLAAEAGASAVLVGMTALILVLALVLGLAV